jgi:DNA polymerase III subunits gamma and tau domain III.
MIYKAAGGMAGVDLYSDREDILKQHAAQFTHEVIVQIIQKLHAAMNEIKWSPQPRITLEVALLSLCYTEAAGVQGADEVSPMPSGRMAQMEAKIAQLTAAISTLTANACAVTSDNSSQAMMITAAPRVAASRPAVGSSAAGMSGVAAPETAVPEGKGSADGTAVWQKLLAVLKEQGKMPVHACVKAGEVRGMNDTQFFIAFKSSFMKARTEREDYRCLLEEILETICGRSLRVICTLETAAEPRKTPAPLPKKKAANPPAQKDTVAVDYTAMSAEERHTLEAAVEVFGDNFVRKEDLK